MVMSNWKPSLATMAARLVGTPCREIADHDAEDVVDAAVVVVVDAEHLVRYVKDFNASQNIHAFVLVGQVRQQRGAGHQVVTLLSPRDEVTSMAGEALTAILAKQMDPGGQHPHRRHEQLIQKGLVVPLKTVDADKKVADVRV
eukprot:scaffold2448_cov250-Pinguiococcus_pyrenoidosus.AAC.11